MAVRVRIPMKCYFISKQFNKATKEFEKDGNKYPAKDKSYSLFALVGSMLGENPLTYEGGLKVTEVKVPKTQYIKFTEGFVCDCLVVESSGNYNIVEASGVEIITDSLDDDDDDDDDDE